MTNWPEKAGQPYRPANGTDGMIFMECWCEKCCHDTEEKPCDIIGCSMAFDIGHPMYPKEWVYDENGRPVCTGFAQEVK